MPRKKKRPNPFDELCKCLDMQATFDDNVKRVYALLTKGEFDLHIVAEILVEAATMPVLAQENLKLCAAVKDLTHKLDIADECIKDYSERMKNAAIDLNASRIEQIIISANLIELFKQISTR